MEVRPGGGLVRSLYVDSCIPTSIPLSHLSIGTCYPTKSLSCAMGIPSALALVCYSTRTDPLCISPKIAPPKAPRGGLGPVYR